MIRLIKSGKELLLEYHAETVDAAWVDHRLIEENEVHLPGRTFIFRPCDLLSTQKKEENLENDATRTFRLGILDGEYYVIKAEILGIKNNLLLHKEMKLTPKTFTAYRDISIFSKIDRLIEEQIIVGGNMAGAIPLDEFEYLLQNFPTSTELTHYSHARITRILQNYFNTMSDAQQKLETYLNHKEHRLATILELKKRDYGNIINKNILTYEKEKFQYIYDEINTMLINVDSFSEKEWQNKIVSFLLLIFPNYITILPNLHIKDYYTSSQKTKNRYIDIALVNANGNIDVVEIKKPFPNSIFLLLNIETAIYQKKNYQGL